MAYQKKYYFSFKQLKTDKVNLVELWQDTATPLTAEEVRGMPSPFIVELNQLDHKFQPVIGKGCEVAMFSDTDRKFFNGLYHVDPKEFMVKHYIDGTINFLGYLNSEMYMETFSDQFNYGTSITGNDGFALADRFTFLTDLEAKYTGLKTEFEILMICLNKIGLPWNELRIALATTFTGFSGTLANTILHESYVDCANFYDEDDYPMTIREVLESILQPYGAQIFSDGDMVYVVDVETRVKGIDSGFITSPIFKRYTYSTEAYIGDLGISINKTIQGIGYAGSGQSIEISGGVNKQVVAYSPYPTRVVLEQALVDENEFETIPATWTAREDYFYKTLQGNQYIQINSLPAVATFESSYYDGTVGGVDQYMETLGYLNYKYKTPYEDITNLINQQSVNISSKQAVLQADGSTGVAVSLKFDFLHTFTDSKVYRYLIKGTGGLIGGIRIYYKLRIGDWYYDGTTGTWVQDSSKMGYFEFIDSRREQWTTVDGLIPIGDPSDSFIYSGVFDFIIVSKIEFAVLIGTTFTWIDYDNSIFGRDVMIWLKNLSIDIVNQNTSEIPTNDVEYVGILNEKFKNEGDKITVTTGTDVYSSDRGKITYYDGTDNKSIQEWTRSGQTYKIEELLLNSIASNYRFGFITLNNFRLRNNFTIFNVFTDNNIADKVFMLKSAKFDYDMNDVECSMWEVSPDRLTIVK